MPKRQKYHPYTPRRAQISQTTYQKTDPDIPVGNPVIERTEDQPRHTNCQAQQLPRAPKLREVLFIGY